MGSFTRFLPGITDRYLYGNSRQKRCGGETWRFAGYPHHSEERVNRRFSTPSMTTVCNCESHIEQDSILEVCCSDMTCPCATNNERCKIGQCHPSRNDHCFNKQLTAAQLATRDRLLRLIEIAEQKKGPLR